MSVPRKFAKHKRLKKEMGRKGQARSGRLGGISKPLKNRRSARSSY